MVKVCVSVCWWGGGKRARTMTSTEAREEPLSLPSVCEEANGLCRRRESLTGEKLLCFLSVGGYLPYE